VPEAILLVGGLVLLVLIQRLQARVTLLEKALAKMVPMAVPQTVPPEAPLTEPVAPPLVTPELVRPEPARPEAARPEAVPAAAAPLRPASAHVPKPVAARGATVPDQKGPIVFTPGLAAQLIWFLRESWVYVVSAASLALAGVFLVQYGIDKGLIPPGLRVLLAIGLGAALIGVGEYLRRRFGDGADSAVAFLPATFSGAGIVVIFAAVMAARHLYGLIGPEVALLGYVATALGAIVLGWFNGALLVAVGLLGAAAAPFLVGGAAPPGPGLYGYYALVCTIGLAVDTVRRWAWVSVLALALAFGGGLAMRAAGAGGLGWVLLLAFLPLVATILPDRSLTPRHAGLSLLLALRRGRLPSFPARLAAGALMVSSLCLGGEMQGAALPAFAALAALAVLFLVWAVEAEALGDLALIPAVVFLLGLAAVAVEGWPLYAGYMQHTMALRGPEVAAPTTASQLAALALAMTLAAGWRAGRRSGLALWQGLGAVLMAPLALVILDLLWTPVQVIGAFPWALHPIALAALMVGFAARFAASDGADHRRTAYAALSALSLVALALFTLTSSTPLTLALALLIGVAAGLDRRFALPEMGIFIQIATAALTWRLMVDPGLFWAADAPFGPVVLAFGGPIAAAVLALWLYRDMPRPVTCGVLESAATFWALMLADILIARGLADGMGLDPGTHWGMALLAMPWLGMSLVQAWRVGLGGPLAMLRRWLSGLAGVLAGLMLAVAVFLLNPLGSLSPSEADATVRGPLLIDTLALAYLVPGLVMLGAGLRLPSLRPFVRRGLIGAGVALALLYAGLEIRRLWQGDWLGGPGVAQGELYTYTLALMILGAALLYGAIARRAPGLRKFAMAVIGVTVAKVFLIDAAGLTGLMRVASFLGLGLTLAGLAWLNRWAAQVSTKG
jgi:uncharacterized membrane protein